MKKALVLCGTVPHILLLEKLKDRGYYTVLADMNPEAPAVPYADEFIPVSAFDKEAVTKAAREYGVELVISSCSEQANAVCCYVGEKLGLPHPYSFETSLDVTNKGRMKALFKKGSVTTADYMLYRTKEELAKCSLRFPVVVKPVDAYSSRGVRKADNCEEMLEFGMEALKFSHSGQGIVEEYCPGVELQVDCVAIGGQSTVLMIRSKNTMAQDTVELNSNGSTVPAPMTSEEQKQAAELAQKICDAFGLINTPFFYQARMNHGVISVLEFAPRIGGGLSFQMIRRATGVDIVDVSIDSFTGAEISLKNRFENTRYLATILLYMQPGVFGSVEGLEELLSDGTVDYAAVLKKKGAEVGTDRSSSNRAVTLLMVDDTKEGLDKKRNRAIRGIRILDIDGTDRTAR